MYPWTIPGRQFHLDSRELWDMCQAEGLSFYKHQGEMWDSANEAIVKSIYPPLHALYIHLE